MQDSSSARAIRAAVLSVYENLMWAASEPEEEEARGALVDDSLAPLAVEGSLQLVMERNMRTNAIDYGARVVADPYCKREDWYVTPTTVLPAPVSKRLYDAAARATLSMTRLIDAVATDYAWLAETYAELAKTDDWTRRMLELARLGADDGDALRCHVLRSDYMLDDESGSVVQIETNTFAASLAGPAAAATKAHRRILGKYGGFSNEDLDEALPRNGAPEGLADGLAAALRAYEARFCLEESSSIAEKKRRPVVLFVTVAEEDNELCHRQLERQLFDAHGIVSLRRTVRQLIREGKGHHREGPLELFLLACDDSSETVEVGVAYFRLCAWERCAGDHGWAVREALARAQCVEVPSAAAHLAGLKRAQVEWSRVSGLDRLKRKLSAEDKSIILQVAATQFALDKADEARQAAYLLMDTSAAYVAKAARDGLLDLPHIFDRHDILARCTHDNNRGALVVQALARPRPRPSLVLGNASEAIVRSSVPELGIFAVALHSGTLELLPPTIVGHLLRSKHADTKDGGLCRGNAMVDSPLIFDDDNNKKDDNDDDNMEP